MSTPVTSSAWVILFRRDSVVDQDTYSISLSVGTSTESEVRALVRSIEKLGYVDVTYALRLVLP